MTMARQQRDGTDDSAVAEATRRTEILQTANAVIASSGLRASVVVNDLGASMHGDGADRGVADDVVAEITAAGGRAVAMKWTAIEVRAGAW